MKLNLKSFFLRWWPVVVLVFFTTIISLVNYVPNTWLAGWDTLLPELNLTEHFSRAFSGAWRQDQGLGAVAAHSHMAELPRLTILAILKLFLPINTLRYVVIFICFILGPLGIYFLVKSGLMPQKTVLTHPFRSQVAAFLAAIFYLFNLGTVQHFIVIFEMFAFQYAFLGWLFLLVIKVMQTKQRKTLLLALISFWLVSFIASPMAYASQLWFAYVGGLIFFLLTYLILHRHQYRPILTRIILIGILTFTANAYWLLPNLYFLTSEASKIPAASQINQSFSIESFLSNASFSGFWDTISLKNFLFNWNKYDFQNQSFIQVLDVWQAHLDNPYLKLWPILVFIIALIGLVYTWKHRYKVFLCLVPVGILALFVIMNASPLFNPIFSILRDNIELVREGLRTPWTKFSMLLMLSLSCLAGLGVFSILSWLKKRRNQLAFVILAFCSSIFFCWPMFTGQLISPHLKITIPEAYFEFWDWSQTQPDSARMALLPAPTFNAWEYYTWGYEGAGFLWFGMPQPFLTRDFDRWDAHNETFYRQLSRAIYNQDRDSFIDILNKYRVSFLVLDTSYFIPGENNNEKILALETIENFLAELNLKLVFEEDMLSVWQINPSIFGWIENVDSATAVSYENLYLNTDLISSNQSTTYQASENKILEAIFYPFANLARDKADNYQITEDVVGINSAKLPAGSNHDGYTLVLPPLAQRSQSFSLPVQINYNSGAQIIQINPLDMSLSWQNENAAIQTANWPSLSPIVLPTTTNSARLVIDLGYGNQFQLENGQATSTNLVINSNSSLEIRYFDENAVFTDENGNQNVSLDQVQIENLEFDNLEPFFTEQNISLESLPLYLTANWPKIVTNQFDPHYAQYSSACEQTNIGYYFKNTTQNQDMEYLSGNNGKICENEILANTSNHNSHLLVINNGQNISGQPLRLSIYNPITEKNDLLKILPEDETDLAYLLDKQIGQEPGSYQLNLENRSFGHIESINTLRGVDIYRINIEPLLTTAILPSQIASTGTPGTQVLTVKSHGKHQFTVNLKNTTNSETILAMNQSFSPGWKATLNGKKLTHVEVNGWKNAWLLPAGINTATIKITFWPQWGGNFGFILLPLTIVAFGGYFIWKRKR